MMKKIIFVFLFWICCFNSFAQGVAPVIQWQNTIGGDSLDFLYSIHQTNDGGYILGGYSNSGISGDKTQNSNGGFTDYWVIKLNSTGSIQWQKTIGGNGAEYLICIQQTIDGGYILGGYSYSNISGDKSENCQGSADYWIIKLDTFGNIQWQNNIGGVGSDFLQSIQQTADGGYILAGNSTSNISGDKTENNAGGGGFQDADCWIIKLFPNGNIQWQNSIGGNKNDGANSIRQTSDMGYIIGGWSKSNISGDKTENSTSGNNDYDYWVIKLDSIGNIVWQNTIGGNGYDLLTSAEQTLDGGYILGGYSYSGISGDKVEDVSILNFDDYWVLKLNSTGNIEWQNTIGGTDFDELKSIHQTADGGFILGGNSSSNISPDKTENSIGSNDFWIIKLNSLGDFLWENTIGGNDGDILTTLSLSSDGGFIIGGYSQSNISGDKTENSQGSVDYWIIKLAPDNGCTTCHKPTNLSSLNISNTKEKLMWTTEPCAIGYRVYHRAIGTSNWIVNVVGSNNGFKTISGLTPNTTYEWKVRSVCSQSPFIASFATTIHTFTTPLRLEDETKTQNDFILYPNPATNEIKISNLSSEANQITIYNLLGARVDNFQKVANSTNATINISDLPSGIYFIHLTKQDGSEIVKKFIRARD